MGFIFGSIGLIIGLILIIFPKALSKILRLSPSRGGVEIRKENKKWKVGMSPTVEKCLGERNAVILLRIIGAACVIISIFTFLSDNSP